MQSKMEKYILYSLEQQRIAQEILHQSNPLTAYGSGLNTIAHTIGIRPRLDNEPDVFLRDRILIALGGNS